MLKLVIAMAICAQAALQGGVEAERWLRVPDWMIGTWHRETRIYKGEHQLDRRDRTFEAFKKVPSLIRTEQRGTYNFFQTDDETIEEKGGAVEIHTWWRSWTVDKRTRRVVSRHSGEQVERCRPGPGVDEMTVEAEAVIDGVVSRWRSVDHKRESASSALDP